MADHGPMHFVLYGDCILRIPQEGLIPKFGSFLLLRHLPLQGEDRVLDLGCGAGLIGIVAARMGHRVVATDIRPACTACASANGLLNGIGNRLDVRTGDLFAPLAEEAFDLIAANPPQMPTPVDRDWGDEQALADNGGPDGWAILERIILEAPGYLKPRGRLVFTLLAFLGVGRALGMLRTAGLEGRVLAREDQPFPRLARERLDHIRGFDVEGNLPAGRPETCGRLVLCGEKE